MKRSVFITATQDRSTREQLSKLIERCPEVRKNELTAFKRALQHPELFGAMRSLSPGMCIYSWQPYTLSLSTRLPFVCLVLLSGFLSLFLFLCFATRRTLKWLVWCSGLIRNGRNTSAYWHSLIQQRCRTSIPGPLKEMAGRLWRFSISMFLFNLGEIIWIMVLLLSRILAILTHIVFHLNVMRSDLP